MVFFIDYLRSWYPTLLGWSDNLFPGLYNPVSTHTTEYTDQEIQAVVPDPPKPRFDPTAPRPWLLPSTSNNMPALFFDVEFCPFMLHSTIRAATHVAFADTDGSLLHFALVDSDGVPVFNEALQTLFASGRDIYGWNPAGDLATLRFLGYRVDAIFMDVLKPYGPGTGAPGPGLAKTCAAYGITSCGKHASGEVIDMLRLYRQHPPVRV